MEKNNKISITEEKALAEEVKAFIALVSFLCICVLGFISYMVYVEYHKHKIIIECVKQGNEFIQWECKKPTKGK